MDTDNDVLNTWGGAGLGEGGKGEDNGDICHSVNNRKLLRGGGGGTSFLDLVFRKLSLAGKGKDSILEAAR